jgi:hypothetical protein
MSPQLNLDDLAGDSGVEILNQNAVEKYFNDE